jgi:hypothetical protein
MESSFCTNNVMGDHIVGTEADRVCAHHRTASLTGTVEPAYALNRTICTSLSLRRQ